MTPSDLSLFWAGFGLCVGLWTANKLWKVKIREKAASGFRLECDGKLYDVRESDNGPAERS